MNTDLMDKKIVFEDENSYSVKEETCQTCKHLFTGAFPSDDPCTDCIRCSLWESHIEEVKFDVAPEGGHDVFKPILDGTIYGHNADTIVIDDPISVGEQLPDSGKRREFSTGSVRDVREGKGRYDLLSPIALKAYAKRMEDGMSKYGERNWEKGQPVMSYIDSAMRHMWNFIDDCMCGRVAEEDHLGAAMWNVASCIHTVEMIKNGSLPNSLDDTPKPTYTVPAEDTCENCCHDFETRGEDANENKNNV